MTKNNTKTIPNGWREATLGDVAGFSKGEGISKNDISSNGKNKVAK